MTTSDIATLESRTGPGWLREDVGAAVWPAFERALARMEAAAESTDGADAARRTLADLRAVVQHRLAAGDLLVDELLWPPEAAALLVGVRRCFVEELRGRTPADTFGAVHVFSALALVQCAVVGPVPPAATADGGAALDLAVEVAHDIRSPLAAILFLADMMRTGRSGAVSELQQQQLGMIYGAALGLNQLACDLIDFVRGGRDIVDREPVPFSLAELLSGVADLVRPTAEEKGLTLRLVLPDECSRVGSPAALGRILLNLTSNAIRHTTVGAVTVSVRELSPTRAIFAVEDTGRDIPAAVVPQLFQPYRRAPDTDGSAFSSAGLGLAICHRLVDALGGELHVSTGAGQGARFWFELDLPRAGQLHV